MFYLTKQEEEAIKMRTALSNAIGHVMKLDPVVLNPDVQIWRDDECTAWAEYLPTRTSCLICSDSLRCGRWVLLDSRGRPANLSQTAATRILDALVALSEGVTLTID